MRDAAKLSELELVTFKISTNGYSNGLQSHAQVTLSRYENRVEGEAVSSGIFEALFQAIDDALKVQGYRTGLRIHAFEDYAPKTNARVRVRLGECEYSGKGSSEEPLEAASLAYLSAISSYLNE